MKILRFFFLFFIFAVAQSQTPIPDDIRPLTIQRSEFPPRIVGLTQKDKVTYYLILEPDPIENTQILVRVSPPNNIPEVMDRLPLMFPLERYISDEAVIKELARQYVQFLIEADPDGKKGMQQSLNHNPAAFSPTATELIEAYQNAGLQIPNLRNSAAGME